MVIYLPLTLIAYTNVMAPHTESASGVILLIWSINTIPIFTLLPFYFTYVINSNVREAITLTNEGNAINEEDQLTNKDK